MKTYSELVQFNSFEDRFNYLKLNSCVSDETFGSMRWLNQILYKSKEWKDVRNQVLIRDNGCDLAIKDRPIATRVYIHHLNPITIDDVRNRSPRIFDLENLVCVSFDTHQAIHYGDLNLLQPSSVTIRTAFDTCPWRNCNE